MIRFFNHKRISKPIANFNDIIKYILHRQTTGFTCDTQFEADMLNCLIILLKMNRMVKQIDREHIGGRMMKKGILTKKIQIVENKNI